MYLRDFHYSLFIYAKSHKKPSIYINLPVLWLLVATENNIHPTWLCTFQTLLAANPVFTYVTIYPLTGVAGTASWWQGESRVQLGTMASRGQDMPRPVCQGEGEVVLAWMQICGGPDASWKWDEHSLFVMSTALLCTCLPCCAGMACMGIDERSCWVLQHSGWGLILRYS